jgi:transposase
MGTITLSAKERKRLELFGKVKRGVLRLAKAAQLLLLSYRQVKRSFRRYTREGASGLAHRLRGRRSNRRSSATRRAAILRRYQERYADFGPTLAAEYLVRDRLTVSTGTTWCGLGSGITESGGTCSAQRLDGVVAEALVSTERSAPKACSGETTRAGVRTIGWDDSNAILRSGVGVDRVSESAEPGKVEGEGAEYGEREGADQGAVETASGPSMATGVVSNRAAWTPRGHF